MQSRHKHRIFDALKKYKSSKYSNTSSNTFTKTNSNSSILELDNMLHSKSTYFYRWCKLPSVCVLALLVGLGINLAVCNDTYADTLSVTFPTDAGTDINPSDSTSTNVTVGEVVYRKYKFNVGYEGLLSNTYYHISVSVDDAHNGNLYNSSRPTFQITGVGTDVAANDTNAFKDNTWGYNLTRNNTAALDTLNYSTIPFINTSAKTFRTDGNKGDDGIVSGTDPFDLTFAAKFGSNAPSGNYAAQVYLSIVMDPSDAVFGGIETMQEMNSDICRDTVEGNSKQLEDTRDREDGKAGTGTFYWVTKLKDGNCWMTQNLAYNGGGSYQWAISSWPNSGTPSYYNSDVSKYYYVGGEPKFGWTSSSYVGNSPSGQCAKTANPETCVTSGHFTKTAPSINGSTSLGEHYKIGNYYTYKAAQSACPSGWRLPISDNAATNGSFGYLLTQYGVLNKAINDVDNYSIYDAPLYFVYGGFLDETYLKDVGGLGRYWSAVPSSSNFGYYLYFTINVDQATYYEHYHGYSVRCVYIPTK